MAASLLCTVVLGALLFVGPSWAITMDQSEVVMRGPPAGTPDERDLFGYSAALHNMMEFTDTSNFNDIVTNASVLVGVPKGSVPTSPVQRTGYVLQCPLTPGECAPLPGSMTGEGRRLYDTRANDAEEEKSDQLLGASMESRDGNFVVCGHKWIYRDGSSSLIQGLCLLSPRSLSGFTLVRPCTRDGTYNNRLRTSSAWQYCSSGSSVSFLPSSELIIGSPGAGNWAGSNFGYNGNSRVPTSNILSSSYSLAGFSVAPVRVSSPTAREWVTGAPRAMEYLGQVYVLDYDVSGVNSPLIQDPLIAITGTKFGAYYGHTVAGVDFNGDMYDDVLVGAPLYFQSSSVPEEGAVYIYRNQVVQNVGSLVSAEVTILTAPGGGVAYSRFGHAIAPLGDLDDDGFDDVAISAPFGEGTGTVYIYRGSRQGIVTTPEQTLTPNRLNLMESVVSGVTTFGAHLSGTTDIDGNKHNDLVIGSFGSRRVFVVRSRTVATVVTSVTPSTTSVIISGSRNCSFDSSENNCFQVDYCWSVRGRGLVTGQDVEIQYTLYADNRPSGLSPRAEFSDGRTTISGTRMLTVGSVPVCDTRLLYVTSGTPFELQSVPLNPSMTVDIPQGAVPSATNGNTMPTDLSQNRLFGRLEGTLSAAVIGSDECGVTGCSADVSVSSNPVQYISRSDPTFNDQNILVGVVSDLVFRTTIENSGPNTAYSLELVFTHPTVLAYSRVEDGAQFTCETDQARTETTCTVTNALAAGSQMPVAVRFVILSGMIGGNVEMLTVVATARTSSNDTVPGNNMKQFSLPLAATVSPAVTGQISADQLPVVSDYSRNGLPTSLEEIGRQISVNFTVTNDGPSAIGQGQLTVYLPYRNPCTRNSSFLFYITTVSVANLQNGICTATPMNSINALQLTLPSSGGQGGEGADNATSTSTMGPAAALDDIPGSCNAEGAPTQTIRCDNNTQGCVALTCVINSQRSGYRGQLSITGHIDDDYFKDTATHHMLYFRAQYQVLDSNSPTEDNTQDNAAEVSLFLRNPLVIQNNPARPVEAWVYVVAIVLPLIAIGIAFVSLWACGFFKRKRKKQLQEQQEQDRQKLQEQQQQQEGGAYANVPEKVDLSNGNDAPGDTAHNS